MFTLHIKIIKMYIFKKKLGLWGQTIAIDNLSFYVKEVTPWAQTSIQRLFQVGST
jgi:hypothetical protein